MQLLQGCGTDMEGEDWFSDPSVCGAMAERHECCLSCRSWEGTRRSSFLPSFLPQQKRFLRIGSRKGFKGYFYWNIRN